MSYHQEAADRALKRTAAFKLREQVAKIKEGDAVTARFKHDKGEFTVSGTAYVGADRRERLYVGYHTLRVDSTPSGVLVAIEAHEPAKPPLPPEPQGDVVVIDGLGFRWLPSAGHGWSGVGRHRVPWEDVSQPVKVYRREEPTDTEVPW